MLHGFSYQVKFVNSSVPQYDFGEGSEIFCVMLRSVEKKQ